MKSSSPISTSTLTPTRFTSTTTSLTSATMKSSSPISTSRTTIKQICHDLYLSCFAFSTRRCRRRCVFAIGSKSEQRFLKMFDFGKFLNLTLFLASIFRLPFRLQISGHFEEQYLNKTSTLSPRFFSSFLFYFSLDVFKLFLFSNELSQ